LVIADLARMKDWSMQDKLMSLYEEDAYNVPSIKRAIVRFMLASAKDSGPKKGADSTSSTDSGAGPDETPAHVTHANECLAELEKKDPKTVHEAKRFFLLK
jgi:hypothetical protein